MRWLDNRLRVDPPKRPKRLTGTRFAAVLGLDKWMSPFQVWCEVTKTYNKPFEGNVYTKAGQTLEPLIIDYLRAVYFAGDDHLVTPEDIYGPDPFKKTWGNFFPDEPIFGGMWDFLVEDGSGKPIYVGEIKTTKRVEDWADGAPVHYSLQAALYAKLLGVNDVVMVGVFLQDRDYVTIQKIIDGELPVTAFELKPENIVVDVFEVDVLFPDMDDFMAEAEEFWHNYVLSGESPSFDERVDADYLRALRTDKVTAIDFNADIKTIIAQAEALEKKLQAAKEDARQLKALDDQIKNHMQGLFSDGSDRVELEGNDFTFTLSKGQRVSVDVKKLEADGLLSEYQQVSDTMRYTKKEKTVEG